MKILKSKICFLILLFIAVSCDNSDSILDDQFNSEIVLDKPDCLIDNNNLFLKIGILKGNGGYKIKSSDYTVATTSIADDNRNYFYIIGRKKGEATVTVTDKNGNESIVNVLVNEDIEDPFPLSETVYLKKGTSKIIKYSPDFVINLISSRYGYIVNANNPSNVNNAVSLYGEKIGKSQVSLHEFYWTRLIYDVNVVEKYDIILSRDDIFLDVYNKDYFFHILHGNGNYLVTTNETLAQCSIIPYKGGDLSGALSSPVTIKVSSMKAGATIPIKITDGEGQVKEITIETGFFMSN